MNEMLKTKKTLTCAWVVVILCFCAGWVALAQAPPPAVQIDMSSRSGAAAAPAATSSGSASAAQVPALSGAPVLGGSGSGGGANGQLLSAIDTAYQICPQDIVEIKVYGQPAMDAVTRVDSRGSINFPPIGQVLAADLTERQVENLLEDRLRKGYLTDPHVSVFVREMHPREVAIIGEVKVPGRYPYLFGCRSMVEILAKSGGMTDKAGGVAYIIRFNDPTMAGAIDLTTSASLSTALNQGLVKRLTVDLNDLLINGKLGANVALQPGDIVTIPDAGYVHITGKGLEKPGVYPLRRTPNTLQQFIDEAGGLKFEASKTVYLIRGTTSGQAGKIETINYKKLINKKIDEIYLKPGDKVIVERSVPKLILASIGEGFTSLIHFGAYLNIPFGSSS